MKDRKHIAALEASLDQAKAMLRDAFRTRELRTSDLLGLVKVWSLELKLSRVGRKPTALIRSACAMVGAMDMYLSLLRAELDGESM